MSSVFTKRGGVAHHLLVVVAIFMTGDFGFAQTRGRPIEFSAPRGTSLETNLDDVDGKKLQENLLKQKLQEDTFRPSSFLHSGDSLSGVLSLPYVPPSAPPVQSRRTRDLLDRQRNWIFLSPEDFAANPGLEEAFGLSGLSEYEVNGLKKKDLTAMERFYQRLERENDPTASRSANEKAKRDKEDDASSGSLIGGKEDVTRDPRVARTESTFRRIFDANPSADVLARDKDGGFLSDLLGKPQNDALSPERSTAQKMRMEEFRQLLESHPEVDTSAISSVTPGVLKPGTLTATPSWAAPVLPSLPTLPTVASSFNTSGTTTPGFNSSAVSQPTYTPPVNPFTAQPTVAAPYRPLPKRPF